VQLPAVVTCAVAAGLGVCPRSGGHSSVGQSSCEGGVMDVYQMKGVKVSDGLATLEAGNTLAEMLYSVLERRGGKRIVGIGLYPSVGVGGVYVGWRT
jgi:FAD/FMN-containing dehydrogenase